MMLGWIGAIAVAHLMLTLMWKIVVASYAFFFNDPDLTKHGKWAVVTGATDGIGKAYAFELARKGMSVFLLSRTKEKLDLVADELRRETKNVVNIRTFAFNFDQEQSAYDEVAQQLQDLDIGVLVNNVGRSPDFPDYYHASDPQVVASIVRINIVSMNLMTRIVLPGMLSRNRGGIVINLGSASGEHPVPLAAVYSSSKVCGTETNGSINLNQAYVSFFSQALAVEYASKGIIVQAVLPGFVATNMAKMKPSLYVPAPAHYVQQAVRTIGVQTVTSGYWVHALQSWRNSLLPGWLQDSSLLKLTLNFRAMALKKRGRVE